MACTVVCISHAAGAGGEEVGRLVADRLGFLYVDEEIVARAAAKGGLDAADVADEEKRKSFAVRALNALAQGGGEAWALGTTGPLTAWDELDSDDVRTLIRETIEQTAARGRAVIVAHAASHAIGERDAVLRVLVTASSKTRTARVAEQEGVDRAGAAKALKDSDAGRADYLKRFYDIRDESPTHYDLVLNTDTLSLEQAAELISRAAS
ncbi:MAG TPA: cytidylate kinase-like family protein [Gaiellaceae bacterium]|nr:cytidylate kinase-like family protein [Gaiellaceae bacterium]